MWGAWHDAYETVGDGGDWCGARGMTLMKPSETVKQPEAAEGGLPL
ncbi:MAG: hypothetical protein LBD24_09695 [Spirochaetaceae bacterium]|nr:hypothetical protein [Spirochaetaceae bacterium]